MLETIIAVAVLVIDQITKYWAQHSLSAMPEGLILWRDVFSFQYVRNTGAAFGMLPDKQWLFVIITVPVIVYIIYLLWKKDLSITARIALSLILSGAVGNAIDRVWLNYVRDFISVDIINFAVFNVADMAVCIGGALLIILLLFTKEDLFKDKAKKVRQDG